MLDFVDKLKQLSEEAEQRESAFANASNVEPGSFY